MATSTIYWESARFIVQEHAFENPIMIASLCLLAFISVIWVVMTQDDDMKRDGANFSTRFGGISKLVNNSDTIVEKDKVEDVYRTYESNFDGVRSNLGSITADASVAARKKNYATMVDSFYTIVTDFYMYGWGDSFHFAPRFKGETFRESIARSEHFLASRLGLTSASNVLDLGCGIGGPMRSIARFSGANVTGITINEYQVKLSNKYAESMGLEKQCHSVKGDFQNLPFAANSFDAAFEIEATCHSPDRVECFKQVFNVLKPGALFGGYEWVVLDKYDGSNPVHVRHKEGIEVGNSLPTLATAGEVIAALKQAGFEIVEATDVHRNMHSSFETPWYEPLRGSWSLEGFRMSRTGALCTHLLVTTLETLRIAPKGSTKISSLLRDTSYDLVEAGRLEIFSPSYFFLARKPSE